MFSMPCIENRIRGYRANLIICDEARARGATTTSSGASPLQSTPRLRETAEFTEGSIHKMINEGGVHV